MKNEEPILKIIRPGKHQQLTADPALQAVEKISHMLDSSFTIPMTKIRFGIDPILSLFPVIGDLITFLISVALIYVMSNHGASRKVVIKMLLNSTFDAVVGSIPLVGTVFDVFYKSNDKNYRLLKEHYFEGKHQGSGNGLLLLFAVICLTVVVLAFYGMYKLVQAIL